MAAQAALVAETIAGMKRAISGHQYCEYSRQVHETNLKLTKIFAASDSDDAYLQPTNRGNKLKRKARFVQDGHSGRLDGPSSYKRVTILLKNDGARDYG